MSNIDKRALRESAEKATKGQWVVEFDDEIYATDGVNNEQIAMVFSENGARDAAFIAAANPATVLALLDELEAAEHTAAVDHEAACSLVEENEEVKRKLAASEKRIASLEAEKAALRPIGVMSERAFHRLERSESRFIALWPRPGIYLPRKRPDDGVIVYARIAAGIGKGE
ncbi:ead/Ea22-like family protein [Escherichia coli]|uniref:ead/Ea22-like family protein n=1 Tax=Escherichia coli TaxID=562 RepID=UPI001D0CB48C|nr:ead/Ea22-like family protein [Escherichia coli]